ncbi:MAG: hypothetical protein ACSHX3_06355 [Litorimonas sp.]
MSEVKENTPTLSITEKRSENFSELADHYRELSVDVEKKCLSILLAVTSGGLVLSANAVIDSSTTLEIRELLIWSTLLFSAGFILFIVGTIFLAVSLSQEEGYYRDKSNAQHFRHLVEDARASAIKNGGRFDEQSQVLLNSQNDAAVNHEKSAFLNRKKSSSLRKLLLASFILGIISLLSAIFFPLLGMFTNDYF